MDRDANHRSSPVAWYCRPKRWHRVVLAAVLASGSGCHLSQWAHNGFKVGPDYAPSPAPVASQWIDYQDARVNSGRNEAEWWRGFTDPTLDTLVENVYAQNLSLRSAGARIDAARAARDIAVGFLFPQVQQASGEASSNRASSSTAVPFPETWFKDINVGLSASWELDFWGRYRRSVEAADAELDAAAANYDDVLVILLSDVASNYVQYRTFEQRLVLARRNVELQTKGYSLTLDKFRLGQTTERDSQQAKQVLEQTKALIPILEIGQRQAGNRLCVLLGMAPQDMAKTLGTGNTVPAASREVAIGVPADLVTRRPDIRRAEREVAAQSARIGIAEADFYPRIALNGGLGVQSAQFGDLLDTPGSLAGSFGPSFRWDILNYGRILSNVHLQDARFRELTYSYQNQVLTAAQEAEDALVAFLKSQDRVDRLVDSVAAARRTVEISEAQYREGLVEYTAVVLFTRTLTEQQDQLAAAQGEVALYLIRLYRALGGGWELRQNQPPSAAGNHPFAASAIRETPAPAEAARRESPPETVPTAFAVQRR